MKNRLIKRCAAKIKVMVNSISVKIMFFILVLVLPLNTVAVILGNVTVNSMIEQAQISVKNVMESYLTEIQNRMSTAQYFAYSMRNEDSNVLKMLSEDDEYIYSTTKIGFYHELSRTIELTDGSDGIFLYLEDRDDLLIWKDPSKRTEVCKNFIRDKLENGYKVGWSLSELDGEQVVCLFISMGKTVYGGWIELDSVLSDLYKDIHYSSAMFLISEEKQAESRGPEVVLYSDKGDFYLTGTINRNEIVGEISDVYKIMQVIAILELMLIPVLYMGISKLLIKPLRIVNQAQKNLQEGDLEYRITQKGNSTEYDYSFRAFNTMAGKIKDLKIESYEKELDKQRMELKNLQLQIRPHFLLNTFNLIYTLSQRNEPLEVQRIILYLSDYFRYLFRSGKDLELFEKELHLIKEYINTARVRYPESIEFTYELDPEIRFVRVPPLLLHNFIENIIKHVVQQGIMTHISLVGQYEDKRVTFMIMDDGPGMEAEQLEELDRTMRKKKFDGAHIGYANSLRRVKYFYGNDADIVISSELGEGTCVMISLPYNLEVEDEFTNCE